MRPCKSWIPVLLLAGLAGLAELSANEAPVVDLGLDLTGLILSGETSITGVLSASVADDGQPNGSLSFFWTKQRGPAAVLLSNPDDFITLATFTKTGTYVMRLTASDGEQSGSDEVTIIIEPRQLPVVVTQARFKTGRPGQQKISFAMAGADASDFKLDLRNGDKFTAKFGGADPDSEAVLIGEFTKPTPEHDFVTLDFRGRARPTNVKATFDSSNAQFKRVRCRYDPSGPGFLTFKAQGGTFNPLLLPLPADGATVQADISVSIRIQRAFAGAGDHFATEFIYFEVVTVNVKGKGGGGQGKN